MSDAERIPQHLEREKPPCVFCEIKDGLRAANTITENQTLMAIISLEGHPLVIPKEHINEENIEEHKEVMGEAYKLALALIPAVKAGLQSTGVNIVTNLGRSAGQEVEHVHIHLLDRIEGDRKLRFAPGNTIPNEVLGERAEQIKNYLA